MNHPVRRILPRLIGAWPLSAALLILWTVTALLLARCLHGNDGQLAYTLDDAYIHLAHAKNLARHGVFGVTRFAFSSSESSLLWALLLAAFFRLLPAAGAFVYVPLIVNLALATALLIIGYRIGTSCSEAPSRALNVAAFLLLLALIFVTPLPWLIFSGMEHLLQTLLTAAFVLGAARCLAGGGQKRLEAGLLVLAPLVASVRYEGLFPVAFVCVLFLLRRRLGMALGLAALALLPLALYGLISTAKGWLWLPNSVVLKSRLGDVWAQILIHSLPYPLAFFQLAQRPYLLLLFSAATILFLVRLLRFRSDREQGFWHPSQLSALVFLFVALANFQSAVLLPPPGGFVLSFTRYDAYLVALGLLVVAFQLRVLAADRRLIDWIAGRNVQPHPALPALLIANALLPPISVGYVFWERAADSLRAIPRASHNIYAQQWQMARFVKRFYDGQTVALNDIGAVNYWNDIRCLDLFGLGTQEVAAAKLAQTYDTQTIARLASAEQARIAIVYRSWFDYMGGLPAQWQEVGRWQIQQNVICGDDLVSFYAIDPAERDRLAANLRRFAPSLPRGVRQGVARLHASAR